MKGKRTRRVISSRHAKKSEASSTDDRSHAFICVHRCLSVAYSFPEFLLRARSYAPGSRRQLFSAASDSKPRRSSSSSGRDIWSVTWPSRPELDPERTPERLPLAVFDLDVADFGPPGQRRLERRLDPLAMRTPRRSELDDGQAGQGIDFFTGRFGTALGHIGGHGTPRAMLGDWDE